MGYRCVNDLFSYCSGEPEWGPGGSCKLDPKTCGKHQTISQQLEGVVLPEGSSHRHTQTAKAKAKKKKGK